MSVSRVAFGALVAVLICVSGCTSTVHQYRVVDVASRREYTAVGPPSFLQGGGISFRDRDSTRMVTLQSYEVFGLEGESYEVRTNPFTGKSELVQSPTAKKAGY